jgi:hypothetical protein
MLPNNNSFNFIPNSGGGPYGNTFLNDVHRIFPAFLYNGSRFQTMSDVSRYVERQMSIHYNVYNNSQNEYIAEVARLTEQNGVLREMVNHIINMIPEPRQRSVSMDVSMNSVEPQISTTSTNNFMTRALGDYIVHGPPFETCCICQNDMDQTQQLTEIRVCRHHYHRNCLNRWIRSHSSCPMCRAYIYGNNDISNYTGISLSTNTIVTPSVSTIGNVSTLGNISTLGNVSTLGNMSSAVYSYWGIDPPMYPL